MGAESGPAMLSTSRAVAPPAGTGDAVVLYYLQTRSRQEAGLFYLQPVRPIGGNYARKESAKAEVRGNRAAIYARVSDKSQAEEDKTSITEQTSEMEAYCERRGLAIVARYQEVGQGWSKKRSQFQTMLNDAKLAGLTPSSAGSPTASAGGCTPPPP